MFSFRDLVVFLAGAEFFHTLVHIGFYYLVPLPIDLKFMILTPSTNNWSIVINLIITIVLLFWSKKLKK